MLNFWFQIVENDARKSLRFEMEVQYWKAFIPILKTINNELCLFLHCNLIFKY
jgi:hypothetical protein